MMKTMFKIFLMLLPTIGLNFTTAKAQFYYGDSLPYEIIVSGNLAGEQFSFDYVDLGLPSGTLWATMNLSAICPTDWGGMYYWGDGKPGDDEYIHGKTTIEGRELDPDIYDEDGNLKRDYDTANIVWGGSWRMPTKKEVEELIRYTKPKRISVYDRNKDKTVLSGTYLVSRINGNHIYFPADRIGFWTSSKKIISVPRLNDMLMVDIYEIADNMISFKSKNPKKKSHLIRAVATKPVKESIK